MEDSPATTLPTITNKKPKKLNPKQRAFIENYLSPQSPTFANLYRSGMKAGFSPTYSMNIKHLNPSWLSNLIETAQFQPEHIRQGIQELAMRSNDSRSPDDTRLKAYEILAKITGMLSDKNTLNVTVVQPILNGSSVPKTTHERGKTQPKDSRVIIDQD